MGLTGGCMCGAVRYELESEPFDCRLVPLPDVPADQRRARRWSSPVFPTATSSGPSGADKVKSVPSSGFGHREFCGECGTPFLMKVDHQPETVDFSVATLDEPSAVAPGFHIFWGSKVGGSSRRTISRGMTNSGRIRGGSREPSPRSEPKPEP